MKRKMFLCISLIILIAVPAACSSKESNMNSLSVSQPFELSQVENTETEETPAADPELVEADDVVVTTEKANIRSGPGENYDVLEQVEGGIVFDRTGIAGDWSRIVYNGRDAYVYSSLIAVRQIYTVEKASGTVAINEGPVNIREGAGTTYCILHTAEAGEEFAVTGKTDTGWYEIQYDGQTAYIYGELVEASVEEAGAEAIE